MAFDNPETLTLLGAVAAWASRVRLVTTVIVSQVHDPVLLAKSLATGDQLCRGRLSVGLGSGVARRTTVRSLPTSPTRRWLAWPTGCG